MYLWIKSHNLNIKTMELKLKNSLIKTGEAIRADPF